MPSDRLKLFLGPNAIKRLGAQLDEVYPGVELWQDSLKIGEPHKFLRVLGNG